MTLTRLDEPTARAALAESPAALASLVRRFDPVLWATEHARIRLPKMESVFVPLPHQIGPLGDVGADEVVGLKASQVGWTTVAIIRGLWFVAELPRTLIYTLPTTNDVNEFAQQRVNSIITRTPYLAARVLDVDRVETKQFARIPAAEYQERKRAGLPLPPVSVAVFSGARTERDPTMVDADFVIHDEEDRSTPEIIEQFQSRLDWPGSLGWKMRLSTPTYPGTGIDRAWARSDMRRWTLRCPHCGHRFVMRWPANIDPAPADQEEARGLWEDVQRGVRTARYICDRCGGTIDDEDRSAGVWVAERPGLGVHGYAISQMSVGGIPAARILERYATSLYPASFWNLTLGEPFQSGTSLMTRAGALAAIEARGGHPRGTDGLVGATVGIDVGRHLDCVIGDTAEDGAPRYRDFVRIAVEDPIERWREADRLLERVQAIACVVDGRPEETEAARFAGRHPGIVWRAYYYTPGRNSAPEVRWNEDDHTVTAPRTDTLTRVSDAIMTRVHLPRYDGSPEYDAFLEHLEASKRVPVFQAGLERQGYVDHYEWVNTGADHLFHAAVYEDLARNVPTAQSAPAIGILSVNRSALEQPAGPWGGLRAPRRRGRWGA